MAIQINDGGPTDAQIEDLVSTFYARIRKDTELGPIFVVSSDLSRPLDVGSDVGLRLADHGVSVVQVS